ncbi:phosphoglycerate kinase [Candidatus Saccharibacteria bacterium]|nr:phosphoglycerate kinase [Candidatus Saccharibacteria bacterium]
MAFSKRTVRNIPISGATVLVRADYNVPLSGGKISDGLRIQASIPTLQYLLKHAGKIVIISHLGRPKGRDSSLSLEPIAVRLEKLLGKSVTFVDDCIGDKVVQAVKKAPKGSVVLLENLRFHAEEEANNREFARRIAKDTGARFFVQDGFGVVHRAHASTEAITQFIPSVAGLLLEKECQTINKAMEKPARPLIAVLGGAKVSDKLQVIERFVDIADKIIIGGAMANTFLAYKGHHMGASMVEENQHKTLDKIYLAAHKKVEGSVEDFIILPTDVSVAKTPSQTATRHNVTLGNVAKGDNALDIGDASIERMIEEVSGAKTVIWNGTMGYATVPAFAHSSARLALELASHPNKTSIIGGGDTADFVLGWGEAENFTHVSTGGGAALDLMAGKKLPGVESLLNA